MNRFSRLLFNTTRSSFSKSASSLLAKTTLASIPLVLYTSLPSNIHLFGLGSNKDNNSGSNVDIEINKNDSSNTSLSKQQQEDNQINSKAKQSELDNILDELFGKSTRDYDPIEEIAKTIPRALWPNFFSDLVEQRQHNRYRDSNTNNSNNGHRVYDDNDTTDKLFYWLNNLAPGHSQWWDFASELSKPYSLHLQDIGNSYDMRVTLKGLTKEQVKVKVNDRILTVVGANKQQSSTDNYFSSSTSAFQQSIRLPYDADYNKLRAKYVDGQLHITIPKKQGYSKDGEITIE